MLGGDYTLSLTSVTKNNGVRMTGIIFEENGKNASPTIYLNELYDKYMKQEITITNIVKMIHHTFIHSRLPGALDMSDFTDYNRAKKNIAVKIVNYEKNKESLLKIPHKVVHNLALICYYTVHQEPFCGNATIQINQSHLNCWKISFAEVYRNALLNTCTQFPPMIEPIGDILRKADVSSFDMDEADLPMYVLTNRQKFHGAICMFYPGLLQDFAMKKQKNIYVLPSSIHEVILLPEQPNMDPNELLNMVKEINKTSVLSSEILADSIYYYDRSNEAFTVFS